MPTRDEKDKFSIMIEELSINENVSHMEAIIEYCSKSGLEIEVAATLVNANLKSKLESEARSLRFLGKSSALPL